MRDHLKNTKKQLDSAYTAATEHYVKEKTATLESTNPEHRHNSSWKIIRELSSSNTTPFTKVRGNSSEERLNVWYDHFKNLLGTPSPAPDLSDLFFNNTVSDALPINCDPLSDDELRTVLRAIKSSKSPGLDNIPPAVWKISSLHTDLLGFCNDALINGKLLEAWKTASIIPFPKKGDLSKPENYRRISLTPAAAKAKVYNKLLLNRLAPYIDPLLRPNQNGFCK